MGTIHSFRPRPPARLPLPPSPAETRQAIEDAAQGALDAADALLAILDRMDGDADAEDGGDVEPSLAAPENHHASQVVWLRGSDRDIETEAPETVVPDVAVEERTVATPAWPLPWSGSSNVVAAAGVALLDMVVGR